MSVTDILPPEDHASDAARLAECRAALAGATLEDEASVVTRAIDGARPSHRERERIMARARDLVRAIRAGRRQTGGIDAFLQEYALSSEEGVVLMCLAEALLRIPDSETADRLIRDKIGGADWQSHLGRSESLFVNASSWGLMLTGRVVRLNDSDIQDAAGVMRRLVHRSGEPIIRNAMLHAMRIMGRQFVLGRTIGEALREAKIGGERGLRYSFDMLGEAARTWEDADRYFKSYENAVLAVGAAACGPSADIHGRNSISVKLSALHPRYEEGKAARVLEELTPRLVALASRARDQGIGLTVDAEEADRLELSLDIFEAAARAPDLAGWNGFGLAVQAYQRRAMGVIDWLTVLARDLGVRMPVRLVKGAYWDTEIKLHQVMGVESFPVFTRKAATDVSYLACARAMLAAPDAFYPQFASHNAHTVAALSVHGETADPSEPARFEYQRLHGMGEPLFEKIQGGALGRPYPVRLYAPVGSHEDLLAYLVRRLLENGANSSFVNRLADDAAPIDEIIADPVDSMDRLPVKANGRITPPADLFPGRKNAKGLLLTDRSVAGPLTARIAAEMGVRFKAGPIIGGQMVPDTGRPLLIRDPADRRRVVGTVHEAHVAHVDLALTKASAAAPAWDAIDGASRAQLLERVADLYEENTPRLMGLCVREAGKTLPNALADLREAVDFLRYYAQEARRHFSGAARLPGPTGERNEMSLHGRGVFACISPWNFPIAIFTGQISAALAAGNCVVAKPAEQTPLIAAEAVRLFHKAGIPGDVLHLLPGEGGIVGAALVQDSRVSGVAFTGSTETARLINRSLAGRDGPIVPLIAETGGQNAMIVDSSALPEQVVKDVLASAFDSAGQRCSALRVLCLQEDIADRVITMLTGAMATLTPGDPMLLSTDVGPVIDGDALAMLEDHAARMERKGRVLFEGPLGMGTEHGTFFGPRAVEIAGLEVLEREIFGPFLHVIRYKAEGLADLCEAINGLGYGLTLGVHTRIEETAREVAARVRVGNIYVNRNQIGAVVGAQPFGGEGLSGTGPKAGGPHYLFRYATERVISTDTTAAGGNAALMSQGDQD
ncbi:MAG: bifunctional proline dehydrogenase/L-glutamate gamma-semialdehyde dehydrogenase PutA [Alphaproteobacteria bacterium]